MKLGDAWRLGHANVKSHKGRSIATIITISVLFGLVMGVNFVLQGMQNSILPYAEQATDGKIYVRSYIRGSNGPATIEKRLAKYHGTQIGTLTDIDVDGMQHILYISPEVVQPWLDVDLKSVPEDKLAYMITDYAKEWLAQGEGYVLGQYLAIDDTMGVEVGMIPMVGQSGTLQMSESLDWNLLDLVLTKISGRQGYDLMVVERNDDWRPQEYEAEKVSVIATFDDVRDAYNYMQMTDEAEFGYSALQAEADEMFNNQTAVYGAVRDTEKTLRVLEMILLVVAIVIMAFTFAHLIDQDAAMVALYRSIGATTKDIVLVSLCYLLELCLWAIVFATVVGLSIAGVVTLMNMGQLKAVVEEFYNMKGAGEMILIGFNLRYLETAGLMLLAVPVAFLLVCDHLSTKHIAMRLKKD